MKQNNWISVGDNLPDFDEMVLVAYKNGGKPCIGIGCMDTRTESKSFISITWEIKGFYDCSPSVDFWMPLPEPPNFDK